ncbi:MAG: hypothetical protein IIC75_04620 [Bacteroidetes bacterium]|nr:hypothetical protein [Bacteroidota bacterium]
MVSDETVLILGAGASKPYGFPTGLELRKDIIFNLLPLLRENIDKIKIGSDFDRNPFIIKIKELIGTFQKSSTSSIDLFLTRDKDFYHLGKQIITILLANYEIKSKFREEIENSEYDWYFNFYEALTKDIINSDEISKFAKNKVSVITFNYDRSLEHFLYESLVNSFRSKEGEIEDLMRKFKIIHVYGKLALLPWEFPNGGVEYGSVNLMYDFEVYSKNLQIIYDERETKTEEIVELISKAKKIFFLGFGYAEENLTAIGFDQTILNLDQRIYGTAYKLTEAEITKNITRLRANNNHMVPGKFHLEDCDSKMLLRNYLF